MLGPLDGVVERRLLVNYRVDPEAAARCLPAPFRPQLVSGWAVAGICLIRLGGLRPAGLPWALSLRTENAAHRFAVEWDTPNGVAAGVYIPRRDTASRISTVVGGRLFPGVHHRARFQVVESSDRVAVGFTSVDGSTSVHVAVEVGAPFESALFDSFDAASRFFQCGSVGYSPGRQARAFDGLELCTDDWRVEPVRVVEARSSFFADPDHFPPGSAVLDNALLMRDVAVRWRSAGAAQAGRQAVG